MVCSYLWASLASTYRAQVANQHLATQPGSWESGITCAAILGGPHTFRVGAVPRMCLTGWISREFGTAGNAGSSAELVASAPARGALRRR